MAKFNIGERIAKVASKELAKAVRVGDTAELIEGVGFACGIGAAIIKAGAEIAVNIGTKKH